MNKTELPQETIWRPFLYGNALRFSATMKACLFAAIIALTLVMQTAIVTVNGAPTEDVPADAAFDPITGILYQRQGGKWDQGKLLSVLAGNTVHSPLTVQQSAAGTIPKIIAGGHDANIPLAIRPKGNSFLQLGPDTYGVSGWAGYDVGTELYNRGTATGNSYGTYLDMTAGDFAGGSLIGNEILIYTQDDAANNTNQLIGLDASSYPFLPVGKTMRQAVGAQAQVESHNAGTITNAYGTQGFVTARDSSHINQAVAVNGASSSTETASIDVAENYQSVFDNLSTTPGAGIGYHFLGYNRNSVPMAETYGVIIGDLTGKATNAYFLWYDSPGVFTVGVDGSTAHYNPAFTKYTPGGTNYERAVQQWNSNVLEYGTQAGGTGTLRGVKILGASLQTPDLTAPTLKVRPGLEPSSPTEGMIYANSSDHHLYFYNGTTWKQLDN